MMETDEVVTSFLATLEAVRQCDKIRNTAAPPDVRLKRFLHYGSEEAACVPNFKLTQLKRLKCMEALINKGKAIDTVTHIVKAHMDGYVGQRDALILALAASAKQKLSQPLKEAAYSAVKKICVTSQDLFLFIQYMHHFGDKTNSGHGWRRAVNDWYLAKDANVLAEIVTKHRGHYCCTHKDVFKLSHIKTDDVAKNAVICYVLRGLKDTVTNYGNAKEAQQVVSYLKAVEDFKRTVDINVATRLLELYNLSLDHVSTQGPLLKTKEMWLSLIPTMSPQTLLDCLQTLSIRGFMKGHSPLVRRFCDALNNPTAVAESRIMPARVFIELRTYELRAKEKIAMALKLNAEWAIKKSATPPKPNPAIVEAIDKLFNSSFKMLIPTGLRYLVAMDSREKVWVHRCWKSPFVTLGDASILIALNLIKTERDVSFGTFVDPQCQFNTVPVTGEVLMPDLAVKVKSCSMSPTPPIVKNVFSWAEANKKQIDVFIILGNNTLQVDSVAPSLTQYRTKMDVPNAKIITCSLNGPIKRGREVQGNGQLCIYGFDEHTPRVIEAFARGAF